MNQAIGDLGYNVKPDRFDGSSTTWSEYRKYFEILANLKGWTSEQKARALAVSLSGAARTILTGMESSDLSNYDILVKRIEDRYDPAGREAARRAALDSMRRKVDQEPADWAHHIERMIVRAYPEATGRHREVLVIENFTRGLTDAQTRQWLQLKNPTSIQEAITLLIHYESVTSSIRADTGRKPREVAGVVTSSDTPHSDAGKKTEATLKTANKATKAQTERQNQQEGSELQKELGQIKEILEKLTQAHQEANSRPRSSDCYRDRPRSSRYGPRSYTDREDRQTLMREGRCFRCREIGHRAKDCTRTTNDGRSSPSTDATQEGYNT